MTTQNRGQEIYNLARELFPICRSITGDGVRRTLEILGSRCGGVKVYEVPTGTRAFDWVVPKEWVVRDAYIECPDGSRIAEFSRNNLHLMGYSAPVDRRMRLDELQRYLYSLPEQPSVIPYMTSYYEERFGFCVSHEERLRLENGVYRVYVDSALKDGFLSYGEVVIPGESEEEIFFSSYVCHPSMANNELSGPCVAAFLARWIAESPRRFTYRLIFIPETIGSIVYLSRNLDKMKRDIRAGFNLSCLGDRGAFSYISSRYGNTLADKAAKAVLEAFAPGYRSYSFLSRGSDERQYNAPFVDLPVCCLARTIFGGYPEYHTSADNMDYITAESLGKSLELLIKLVESLEANGRYKVQCLCEPHLSSRGLYPTESGKNSGLGPRTMMNFIAYCDGKNDIFDIARIIKTPVLELVPIAARLTSAGLIAR
ncbi:MAG: DUF4910 domain-containing protein [Synergistaceae bacterium]|jgi:aminopeptidase-like protein|nr:DUF4910 domain-containing protein [Synergistaceae bacterium]